MAAGPSEPVEILGLQEVPSAGDEFLVFEDERSARALAESRSMKMRLRQHESSQKHVSLDDLFSAIEAGEIKDLNLVVKADVQGSIEALSDALEKIDQSEVRINIVHSAVGGITETDIQLATVSNAIVIGFNVRPTPGAKTLATEEQIDVRLYRVIYQAIEEINAARVGMLAPEFIEEDTARVEVRELFRVPKMGVIAGSYVLEGEINRDDKVRIVRDSTVIYEGLIGSLRRFKEDVKSVRSGYECGVGIEGFQDLKDGDIIEGYRIVEVARKA
jgi:translation initiation factor IF-2